MDLANSERESVIESAIDTISAIGWDSASGNSVWQHKQSEVFGAVGLISGRSDLNGGLNNEVAEDSRNLHSDASSIYPDNNKFGSLLSSEFSHHIPDMTQNLQRQDTFENTPTMDNREEFTEVTPTAISKVKQTYCNQQYPVTRTINAISSSRGSCGESLPSTSIRPSNEEENCKATLHGHEVGRTRSNYMSNLVLRSRTSHWTARPCIVVKKELWKVDDTTSFLLMGIGTA